MLADQEQATKFSMANRGPAREQQRQNEPILIHNYLLINCLVNMNISMTMASQLISRRTTLAVIVVFLHHTHYLVTHSLTKILK